MGELDQAAADSTKALELNADVWPGPIQLSKIYLMQGRLQDALSEIELVRYEPVRALLYPITYFAQGRKREADAALSRYITKSPGYSAYGIAQVYAFRNQSDEAFEWLDRAYAEHNTRACARTRDLPRS
jgi:tetratricopeptide (TPR) repeat protein